MVDDEMNHTKLRGWQGLRLDRQEVRSEKVARKFDG